MGRFGGSFHLKKEGITVNVRMIKEKCDRAMDFTELAIAIVRYEGNIPRATRREVAKYKRIFKASSKDPVLGEIMAGMVTGIEALESYIIARNAGDEVKAARHRMKVAELFMGLAVESARLEEELRALGH